MNVGLKAANSSTPRKSRIFLAWLALSTLVLCSQCQNGKSAQAELPESQSSRIKPALATPIDPQKAELGGKTWEPAWDAFIERSIPPEMLGSQVPMT